MIHTPVLCNTILNYLTIKNHDIVFDGTLGFGGHSQLILNSLSQTGHLIAFDQDSEAVSYCQKQFSSYSNLSIYHRNFSSFSTLFPSLGFKAIDKVLLDLGFSSFQLDKSERGFSFQHSDPLDMRMNTDLSIHPASYYLNHLSLDQLSLIFYKYGELFHNKILSKNIISDRRKKAFVTTDDLLTVIKKSFRFSNRRHFIKTTSQVFQALRIHVNDELTHLQTFLDSLTSFTKTGSRIVILSFHSLEDRIVKQFLKQNKSLFKALHRSVLTASQAEISENSRAHCVKMRAFERL